MRTNDQYRRGLHRSHLKILSRGRVMQRRNDHNEGRRCLPKMPIENLVTIIPSITVRRMALA